MGRRCSSKSIIGSLGSVERRAVASLKEAEVHEPKPGRGWVLPQEFGVTISGYF